MIFRACLPAGRLNNFMITNIFAAIIHYSFYYRYQLHFFTIKELSHIKISSFTSVNFLMVFLFFLINK